MRLHTKSIIIAAAFILIATAVTSVHAQSGIIGRWLKNTGGTTAATAYSWTVSDNWAGFAVPNASGDIANVMINITANQFIKLDGGVTIGALNLGDLSSTQTFTIGEVGVDTLTFNNQTWGGSLTLGGRSMLNKVQGGADAIVSNIMLVSDLAIYNRIAFSIDGAIGDGGGQKSLLTAGTTNVTLTGLNTYTGDTIIPTTGGTLFLNTTGGNAIVSPLIRLGNSTYDGPRSSAMTLMQSNQISDTSVIRFDGASGRNAIFRLEGFNETIKGMSDYTAQGLIENNDQSVAPLTSLLTLNTAGNDFFYNGFFRDHNPATAAATGIMALTKNNAGMLTLSGANINYTGATTVNLGALKLTNTTTFNSAIALTNAASMLELSATTNWDVIQAITGPGSVSRFDGTNTVFLRANNTYTGSTTISDGTLQVGAYRTTVSDPATIVGIGARISGTSSISISRSGILNISNLTDGNNADRVPNAAPITMNRGGITFTNNGGSSTNYSETLGTVTLTGGTNTIQAGKINVGAEANALSSQLTISSLIRQPGSTLNFTSAALGPALGTSAANKVVVTGLGITNGIIGGWATVDKEWATIGGNGVTALASYNTGAPGSWTSINNVKMTATQTLPAASTVDINSLNLQSSSAVVLNMAGSALQLASGGILSSGNNHRIGAASGNLSGSITVLPGGSNELIINVSDTSTRTLTVFSQFSNYSPGNFLSLVKTGPGRLIMTPEATNNTYSGGTTILEGTIEIKLLGNLGDNVNSSYLVLNGGGLELATGSTITIPNLGARQLTIGPNGGRLELDVAETLNLGASVAQGLLVTGPGRLSIGTFDASGGTVNANGVISVTGGLTVEAGTLNLNNPANTFSGGISITGGVLVVPSTGSIPDGLDLNMVAGGVFKILDGGPIGTGNVVTIGSLSGTSALAVITTATTNPNPAGSGFPATLIIDQDSNTTFAGEIKDVFGTLNGKSRLSLVKKGSGILALTSIQSSYRGTTTIMEGAISVTKLGLYGDGSGGIGSGDYNDIGNSAQSLFLASGTSLIFTGSTPSITDRSFTMGTGSEGAAIYANGTLVGGSLTFVEYPGEQVEFDTPNVGATLTLGGRNRGNNTFGLALVDNGTAALTLVKTGDGTWTLDNLNNSNTFTGPTIIYEGRLVITGDGALGAKGGSGPPVQVMGGILDLVNVNYTSVAGAVENLMLAGGRLETSTGTSSWAGNIDTVTNVGPTIFVGRDAQLTVSGNITGAGAMDKDSFGTLILSGVNSYAGFTRIRDGILVLDYTTNPGNNKLADGDQLIFGNGRTGGTLILKGGTTSVTEIVSSTSVRRGEHQILRDTGNTVIDLRNITNDVGGTIDFQVDNLAKTTRANTDTVAAGGILGAWATVGHTTWAYKAADGTVSGFIKGLTTLNYTADLWLDDKTNTDAQSNFFVSGEITNTLRFNQAGPVVLTLAGTNTINSGGILVTPNVNAVQQIKGGTLTAGATGGNELIIQQYSNTSGLIISSTIKDRVAPTASPIGVQKLGPGVLAVTGLNTYTGTTTIGGGTLLVNMLADGGLPSNVGQSISSVTLPDTPTPTAAQINAAIVLSASALVVSGGSLEYTGQSTTVNRGFTVREFGGLSVGNEDITLGIMGDDGAYVYSGNIVGEAGTALWTKTGAGTLHLIRKETSGGASGIQTLEVSDGKLILENRYSTTPATPFPPNPPNANDRLINLSANLTVAGGTLEYIGDDYVFNNGISLQRLIGQFTVGTGASEIKVTSQLGLNPLVIQRTDLRIGDPNNAQDILRELGGTVLFVENPNGGQVILNLYTSGQDQGKILPWSTYQNTANIAQPGVNNFAAIEQTDQTVVSADQKSLYSIKSDPANWNNNGLENISEEGFVPFGGSNVGSNFKISTLRFFNDNGPGTITLTDSLTLTNGAILIAANVKNNLKTLTGGMLTSNYLPVADQVELMIHNYNPLSAFQLESQIVNPSLNIGGGSVEFPLNLTLTGTGTTALYAANTYTGKTFVTGGVAKLENANALPGGIGAAGGTSALIIDGGQIGLTAASGSFTRSLGTGIHQFQFTSSGGFAAYGANGIVNIGGSGTPAKVVWGANNFVPSGDTLILSAADSDKTVIFQNPIELGVTDRLVRVENGAAAEDAVLSGALSGFGGIIKNGEGALRLSGTNVHIGGVVLAEGTLFVPSPSVLGTGALSVGINDNTTANDVPTLVLEGGTIPNSLAVGNKNSAGITNIEVPNNVTLSGTVALNKTNVFTGPDLGKTLTVNGVVSGTGGLTLVDGGMIVLNSANTYGSGAGGAGTAINGSTIIRNGTIEVNHVTALGNGTKAVELGDAMFAPVLVDTATTGNSITTFQGSFDPNGNGLVGSVNGIGAFYDVSNQLDGVTYGLADANPNQLLSKKILVKDQGENPEQNGLYSIYSVDVAAGTMNLTRVDDGLGFPLTPDYIIYGTDVTVQNGTLNTGMSYFLGKDVDAPDINKDGFYWKTEASLNPNVSLVIGKVLATPITNPIDINDTNGTGVTSIGLKGDILHGSATLSGPVTLQSQITGAEDKDLFLSAEGCADLIFTGSITDPGAGDTLNLIKTGEGTVTLSGANDYDGFTRVSGGVLKLNNATALGGGNLDINGGVVGLTTASGSFSRALGTGAGQVRFTGSGGFAAFGTNQTVSIGASVTWNSTPNFLTTGQSLVFGSEHATAKATLTTNIALGTARRTIKVDNGPAVVEGEISGQFSAGAGGSILKTGHGTLLLSNALNSFGDSPVVQQGKLQAGVVGAFASSTVEVGSALTTAGDVAAVEFLADPVGAGTRAFLNPITVGNNPGIKRIDATNGPSVPVATNDVQLSNGINIALNQAGNNHVFIGPDANARLQVSGAVTGAGGITVVDGGTLILSNAGNNYGTGILAVPAAAVDGDTIIRSGIIEVTNSAALGTTLVELGDLTTLQTAVDRASNGTTLSDCGAIFSTGTFTNVSTTFDGFTYTSPSGINKRLLIKDELDNPERNGIYLIQSISGTSMTLVRVADFNENTEMTYGSQVAVTNGSSAGGSYFLVGGVATPNTTPVNWQPATANPSVALIAATTGLVIANDIDLNATGSTGTTTLGAPTTLASGTATFSGAVTMQSLKAGVETLTLDVTSSTRTNNGVTLSGVISDAGAGDLLQVRKIETGVVTLSSPANTYEGGTLVTAGVLLVNNTDTVAPASGTGTGTVSVTGVGTVLGGTGSIAGLTTIGSGAILQPGGAVIDGNATFESATESLAFTGGLTLASGSTTVFQLNGATLGALVSGYDHVSVTGAGAAGTLNVSTSAAINIFLGYSPTTNQVFNVFDWTSLSYAGSDLADQLVFANTTALNWDTSKFHSDGELTFIIPEPSRMMLLLLGAMAGLLRRRSRASI